MSKIFSHDRHAARDGGTVNDQCVPERHGMESVKINGAKDELWSHQHDIEARIQLHPTLHDCGLHRQLAGSDVPTRDLRTVPEPD